jgi:conjugal transfer pilus assembly protein TraV
MRKILTLLLIIATCTIQAGCGAVGAVINPYSSEFNCPMTDKGKCVALPDAYDEAINASQHNNIINNANAGTGKKSNIDETQIASSNKSTYQDAVYGTLNKLLDEPVTPIIAPPKVLRILFLPYKSDSNDLLMYRYAYIMVDEPKWVLGEYLNVLSGDE